MQIQKNLPVGRFFAQIGGRNLSVFYSHEGRIVTHINSLKRTLLLNHYNFYIFAMHSLHTLKFKNLLTLLDVN